MNNDKSLVVCLAGGLFTDGSLMPHIKERVRSSVELAQNSEKCDLLFSSSFTLHKPAFTVSGKNIISESSVMAQYSKSMGYRGTIYCEQQSHDTIGSAYFVFSDFVSFLKPKKITVVTSDFHIKRTEVIFSHLAEIFNYNGIVKFFDTPSSISNDRWVREEESVEKYIKDWAYLSDLCDFRMKFFLHHSNYNFLFSSDFVSDAILGTY
jgi:hypothetical protein